MSKSKYLASAISAIYLASSSSILAQDAPSVEELWEIVQAQQAELERLRSELENTRSQTQTIEIQSLENSERLEVVADVMEQGGGSGGQPQRAHRHREQDHRKRRDRQQDKGSRHNGTRGVDACEQVFLGIMLDHPSLDDLHHLNGLLYRYLHQQEY